MSLVLGCCLALAGQDGPFVESTLSVPRGGARLALQDVTGDGRRDLVWLDHGGAAVRPQLADGRFAGAAPEGLKWPEGRVAWDLADLDGDGAHELVLLVDGDQVRAHRVASDGTFDAGRLVLEGRSYLPAGVNHVGFARDVDGDGRIDLVLPSPGAHRIHLQTDAGWAAPFEVSYEADVDYQVGEPQSLSSRFGQDVRVPWFRMQDVDGDGRRDLISETQERVAFHLADGGLASQPTWVLDLEALRAELPASSGVDLDDLFSNVSDRVDWRLADLDGVAPHDLILALGSKVRVYLGGAARGPRDAPDQLLKSSGNVLYMFVRDVHGSTLPDLQLVRAERISLGRVLRYLILPGSLDFDLFTYENEGGSFSRRPTRRNKVTLQIPRLLAFMKEAEGFGDALEAQFDVPARRLTFDSDGRANDVVDIVEGRLVIARDCAPPASFAEELLDREFDLGRFFEGFLLDDLDARGDGASRTLDLADLSTYDFAPGAKLRAATRGKARAHHVDLPEAQEHRLGVRDLNGDGLSDLVVIGKGEKEYTVQLLVRRAE